MPVSFLIQHFKLDQKIYETLKAEIFMHYNLPA